MIDDRNFLSHRLRGFDKCEHTLLSMRLATQTDIPFLEIDTRVSKDGVIFVHHDDKIKKEKHFLSITNNSSKVILDFIEKYNLSIITLDTLLAIFSQRKNKTQKLLIDIKDHGFEASHLELIQKHSLQEHIYFGSWIPQTLIKLHQLDSQIPKILFYIPIPLYFGFLSRIIRINRIPFSHFIVMGSKSYKSLLHKKGIGFQHAYFSHKLSNELISILSKNGGGVCIPKYFLNRKIIQYYKSHSITISVFSAQNRLEYNELVQKDVDIVCCDFIDEKPQENLK